MSNTLSAVNFVHRSCARVCAVQVLYQHFYLKNSVKDAIENTLCILREDVAEQVLPIGRDLSVSDDICTTPDDEFLHRLVHGVLDQQSKISDIIEKCLPSKYHWSDLDIILKFILQLGVYEMLYCEDVAYKVVISEYIQVSRSYFAGKEYSLVNFVLDQVHLHKAS